MSKANLVAQRAALIKFLVNHRKAVGLRQIDIAKQIKQSQSWLAYLESGRRRIDVFEFMELAEAYGLDSVKALRQVTRVRNGASG